MTDSRIDTDILIEYIKTRIPKKEIAKELDVSPKTLYNRMKKLGLDSYYTALEDFEDLIEHAKKVHRDNPEKIEALKQYSVKLSEMILKELITFNDARINTKKTACLFVKEWMKIF